MQHILVIFSSHINSRDISFKIGQLVTYEITDTDDVSCPSELLTISVPKCDEAFDSTCAGNGVMPYERSNYDKDTGQSPNNPRRQVYSAKTYFY